MMKPTAERIPSSVKTMPELPLVYLFLMVFGSLLLGYNVVSHLPKGIGDEDVHAFQVGWFVGGRYEIFQYVTMLPVYHGMNAALLKLVGAESFQAMRIAQVFLASLAIPVFFLLCRRVYANEAGERTLHFFYLPLLFPLFFLIYTDIPALIFSLAMVERTLRRRYLTAALCALVAVAMRQPNLVWVAFACVLALLNELGPPDWRKWKAEILSFTLKLWPFALVFFAFAVFVVVNGGVAVGDADQHPVSFNPSNLYFFLFVSFCYFLPLNIALLPEIFRAIIDRKWLLLLLLAGFVVYMLTYEHPHRYNSFDLAYYRRNWVLHYTSQVGVLRVIFYFLIAWMALTYWVCAQKSPYKWQMYALYFFAVLSIVPLPLIEFRYYFVAHCLFIVFRPPQSALVSVVTLVWYMAFTAYLLFNISRANFFM